MPVYMKEFGKPSYSFMICCGHTAVQYLGLPMAVISKQDRIAPKALTCLFSTQLNLLRCVINTRLKPLKIFFSQWVAVLYFT